MRVYLEGFSSWGDLQDQFEVKNKIEEPLHVFAIYGSEGYDGYATVIYTNDGVIFNVVEGSHCSCYGLEGQWQAEDHMTLDALRKMGGGYAAEEHKEEFNQWLDVVGQHKTKKDCM